MEIKNLTSLIVEPTNTCNLRCSFCYVTEGMERPEGFMSLDLFKKVVDDCPDLEHLCMHNWGEPLLNRDIFDMFDYAHNAGVQWLVMNTVDRHEGMRQTEIAEAAEHVQEPLAPYVEPIPVQCATQLRIAS